MAKKRSAGQKESKLQKAKALSRREFFKRGAAVGGAAVLSRGGEALAQSSLGAQGITWNYEADVVVLGSGCVGLHAAVRARDLGASVLVIEQNFDVGGKVVHSGGWTSLGGGDAIQERDRIGADPQGMGLKAPLINKADTLGELAKIVMGNPHQNMPLKYLEATVTRFNASAGKGTDEDFEKPVLHRIDTPPFYAAFVPIRVNDSYGGLRINGKAQVLDTEGKVIPGLYAGGEASGGGAQHGIGRASVHGYIAGTNAAQESSA